MSRLPLQIAAIFGVTILLFVGWDFSQRIMVTVRSQQAEQQLDREIARAQATQAALLAQKQYAQTDAFVEERARNNNYVRDGETLVHPLITPVPAAPTASAPAAMPTPTPGAVEQVSGFFQNLFEFLFGP
jgi:cell division protein FtsB